MLSSYTWSHSIDDSAVVRLERGVQDRRIIDGVRPPVARKNFKSPREPFRDIRGQRVVVGVPVRQLGIHAVERHGHAKPARETNSRRQLCKQRIDSQASERRIRPGWPEEIEGSCRTDKPDGSTRAIGTRESACRKGKLRLHQNNTATTRSIQSSVTCRTAPT